MGIAIFILGAVTIVLFWNILSGIREAHDTLSWLLGLSSAFFTWMLLCIHWGLI